jgi:uncharacterized membrane protein YkvA (DUF1232 family)
MDEKNALHEKRELVPAVPGEDRINFLQQFFYDMELAWHLFWDGRVSFFPKLIPLAWVLYVLMPLDIAPDVVPVLGQLDDISLFFLALKLFISLAPRWIVDEYLERMGLLKPTAGDEDVIEGEVREVTPEDPAQEEPEKPEAAG